MPSAGCGAVAVRLGGAVARALPLLLLLLLGLAPPSSRADTVGGAHLASLQRHTTPYLPSVHSVRHGGPRRRLSPRRALGERYPFLEAQEAARKEPRSNPKRAKGQAGAVRIELHGNAVLTGTIRVYLIYYGQWWQKSRTIETFVNSLSNSSSTPSASNMNTTYNWWKMSQAYHNGEDETVGKVVFGGRAFDKYSQGKDLTSQVASVVYRAIKRNLLPADSNGVYMVLPSADVKESPNGGFCAGTYPFKGTPIGYCGWHSKFYSEDVGNIPYAFIGNANQCPKRCGQALGRRRTPNGNLGIDAMVNVLAHELTEAATDWDPGAGWYDAEGGENADKCNRNFGKLTSAKGGSYVYNMVGQGGMRWLVQQNWDLPTQSCRMAPEDP